MGYEFKSELELLEFIKKEVRKYTGNFRDDNRVMYSYNRLTVEELAQEVYLKILKSVQPDGICKKYVRQAVVFVCIDEYRRYRLNDPVPSVEIIQDETFELTERLMTLHIFEPKELEVIMLLIEGKRNPEVREELKIPKMSYYTMLKRIKLKYIESLDPKDP